MGPRIPMMGCISIPHIPSFNHGTYLKMIFDLAQVTSRPNQVLTFKVLPMFS